MSKKKKLIRAVMILGLCVAMQVCAAVDLSSATVDIYIGRICPNGSLFEDTVNTIFPTR